ncbi:MAG: hypothetical protein C3F11_16940 [Methylocystaceae bacterium]|nr:MAG: hypothetical protein C3F11_16940 [Methylocystaceae bacterium]
MRGLKSLQRMAIAVALALLVSAVAPAEPARHSEPGAVASASTCLPDDADGSRLPAGGHASGGHECVSCLPCGLGVAIVARPLIVSLIPLHSTQFVSTPDDEPPPSRRRAHEQLATGPPSLA